MAQHCFAAGKVWASPDAWKCRPKYVRVSMRSKGQQAIAKPCKSNSQLVLVGLPCGGITSTDYNNCHATCQFAAEHPEQLEHDMSWVVTPIIKDVMSAFKCYASQCTTSSKRNVIWHKKGVKLVWYQSSPKLSITIKCKAKRVQDNACYNWIPDCSWLVDNAKGQQILFMCNSNPQNWL